MSAPDFFSPYDNGAGWSSPERNILVGYGSTPTLNSRKSLTGVYAVLRQAWR
jgi:hypothetical protein